MYIFSSSTVASSEINKFKVCIAMNQVPGTTTHNLALYYMMKTPLEENPLLERFVNGDDAYRNSRFKLIPYISKVSLVAENNQIWLKTDSHLFSHFKLMLRLVCGFREGKENEMEKYFHCVFLHD